MSPTSEAQARILGRVRAGLARERDDAARAAAVRARLASPPRGVIPARARGERPALVERFVANLEKEFGTVERLRDAVEVPGRVAAWLAARNLPARLAAAPHPELLALPWADRPALAVRFGRAEADDAASLTACFAAVAETGTLVLASGPDHPTTLGLLPEAHLVLLRTSRIVGAFEEAWDLLRAERGRTDSSMPAPRRVMPRAVMLVTGPSRSADIEQTLELGAHGPRALHVLLLEDEG